MPRSVPYAAAAPAAAFPASLSAFLRALSLNLSSFASWFAAERAAGGPKGLGPRRAMRAPAAAMAAARKSETFARLLMFTGK